MTKIFTVKIFHLLTVTKREGQYVDVVAETEEEAFKKAIAKYKRKRSKRWFTGLVMVQEPEVSYSDIKVKIAHVDNIGYEIKDVQHIPREIVQPKKE